MNKWEKKKTICDVAEEYKCPYVKRCNKKFGNISQDNLSYFTDQEYLWTYAKRLNKTCKIWFDKDSDGKIIFYLCNPAGTEIKSFHDLEIKKLTTEMKKGFLSRIRELKSNLKNLEAKIN